MAEIIKTNFENLLAFRRERNLDLFIDAVDGEHLLVDAYCQVGTGLIMKARTSAKKAAPYIGHANKPINPESLMIQTHNFADPTAWDSTDDGTFTMAPLPGYKLVVTSIVARFPDAVDLASNPLSFTIWKYVPPYGLIPAVTETYSSTKDLLVTSNSWWHTVEFANSKSFTDKMLEVKFRYADDDTNNWSKLTLFSSRGEKITCTLGDNTTPLKHIDGSNLLDPCYSIFNTKRVPDF